MQILTNPNSPRDIDEQDVKKNVRLTERVNSWSSLASASINARTRTVAPTGEQFSPSLHSQSSHAIASLTSSRSPNTTRTSRFLKNNKKWFGGKGNEITPLASSPSTSSLCRARSPEHSHPRRFSLEDQIDVRSMMNNLQLKV
jgi:hypothetical protein